MAKQGITVETTSMESATDWGSSVADFYGGQLTMLKYVGYAVLVIVIGGAGMLIFNVAKDPIKAAGTAAKLKGGM